MYPLCRAALLRSRGQLSHSLAWTTTHTSRRPFDTVVSDETTGADTHDDTGVDGVRLGADEAGKGPVLGPMVAGAVRADPAVLPADVDDSKRLSASRREMLAAELRADDRIAIATAAVAVDEIDDPETDMNGLTVTAQVRALAAVAQSGDDAVVDAGDTSEARFGRRVADGLDDVTVHATHRADEHDPVVAAASVLAKVERDRRIEAVDARHDQPVGSGYPSDQTTRAFLADYVDREGELPSAARASWQTATDVLDAAAQSGLDEF